MKAPDPTSDLLPPARLAEIRERVSYTVIAEAHNEAIADRAALLRHLDALQAPAPDDGGEALGRGLYERGRSISMSGAQVVPWECLTDNMKSEHIENALALDAHGYARGLAAGRSEGETERGQLQAIVDGEREGYKVLLDKRDAEAKRQATASADRHSFEIEEADRAFALATNRALRAEAERDALAKRLDLGPAEVVTLAAWGEEKAKSARLTAEIAEERALHESVVEQKIAFHAEEIRLLARRESEGLASARLDGAREERERWSRVCASVAADGSATVAGVAARIERRAKIEAKEAERARTEGRQGS